MPKRYKKLDPGARKGGDLRENALEGDPRFATFQQLYVQYNGNGYRAACEAGYPPDYAKSYSYLLVARLKLKVQPVMRRFGLDEVFVARKIKKLARARVPKWNRNKLAQPAKLAEDGKTVLEPEVRGDWDAFEDASTQMRAVELAAELLNLKPARTIKGEGPGGAVPIIVKHSVPRPEEKPQSKGE